MWVTARQAAELLAPMLPVREHARLVLRAGFAGEPVRTRAALLYDEAAVTALAQRPPVRADELAADFPGGLFVARLPRLARVDVRAAWAAVASLAADQPAMPGMTTALTALRIRAALHTTSRGLPWVATLCGYVAVCAEAQGLLPAEPGRMRFDLVEPGEWAASLTGRLLPTRPGRPWLLLDPGRAGLSRRGRLSARGGP